MKTSGVHMEISFRGKVDVTSVSWGQDSGQTHVWSPASPGYTYVFKFPFGLAEAPKDSSQMITEEKGVSPGLRAPEQRVMAMVDMPEVEALLQALIRQPKSFPS